MPIHALSHQSADWNSLGTSGTPAAGGTSSFAAALGEAARKGPAAQQTGTSAVAASAQSSGSSSVIHAAPAGSLTPVPTADSPLATAYSQLEAEYGGTPPIDAVNATLAKLGILAGTVSLTGGGQSGIVDTTA